MEKNKGHNFFLRKLFFGSLSLSVSEASQKIIGLILLPIFTFYLSPTDFGIIAMVTMTISLTQLLTNPGVTAGSMRLFYDTETKDKDQVFVNAFSVLIILPIILGLIFTAFGDLIFNTTFKNFSFYPYGLLAVFIGIISQPKQIWSSLQIVKYRVPKLAYFTLIAFILNLLISIILIVIFNLGVLGRIWGMIIGPFFLLIVSFLDFKKYAVNMFSLSKMIKLIKYSFPLTFSLWSFFILTNTDRIMLERLMSLSDVGLYDIGFRIASVPLFITMGFRRMWDPIFYENMKKENYKIISKLISIFIAVFAFICAIIILFSKEVILLLVEQKFYGTISVIPLIVFGVFFNGSIAISNAFLVYDNKFKAIAATAAISSLLNIVLNYYFILMWGINGAAIGTATSYMIYFLLVILIAYKNVKKVFSIRNFIIFSYFIGSSLLLSIYFNDLNIILHEILIKIFLLVIGLVIIYCSNIFKNVSIHKIFKFQKV